MTDQEKVTFANDRGESLSGVLHHPAESQPSGAVILCHGMDSDKDSEKLIALGHRLAEKSILALRFDFSYTGESSGKFEDITYSGEVEDLQAAYRIVQERQSGKIAVFGSSMGGTIALLFAAREPSVAALVTLAAPLHPEKFPRRILTAAELQNWRERGFTVFNGRRLNVSLLNDLEQLDVPGAARNIRCPVLVLHGDADEVVPVKEARELHGCLSGTKRLSILSGADHRLSDQTLRRKTVEDACAWLIEHVR